MKFLFFKKLFFLSIAYFSLAACNREDHFQLTGEIGNSSTDISYIGMSSGFIASDFSSFTTYEDENQVENRKFKIEGTLDYPHAFRFMTNSGEISGLFFLDPNDDQSLVIDTLGMNKNFSIRNSKTNEEYLKKYQPLLADLNKEHNYLKSQWNDSLSDGSKKAIHQSIQKVLSRKDEVLVGYIKNNPDSYVGMWILAENFSVYGYKADYQNAYDNLSEKLKSTSCGIQLKEKLSITRISGLNGALPDASLFEYKKGEKDLSFKNLPSKYTLIDFWGSFCAPCIRAFPKIKSIYDSTDREYFDVLAISVDSKDNIDDWEEFIENKSYPWRQFLDEEMKFSKMLMINAVPANFLLDSNGTILMKNFSPEELEEFLEEDNA
ncbi:thiol:disulfide interchange protein [Salinimicrobium marinum]|uniref:Thiol:disulfide interchange protein n=1 Tax=Salinimicrobium marinum TaxID=680283 RepID=A0A918W1A8_9FLAO|nr:TlpA disulfide reductase family protein [Salinimicrobium marinum]GHA48655.1 thiol:disulfide interchange protein [Salinimicrobium marinum]